MQTLQKFPYDKLNRKNAHFSQELQLVTILLLMEDLYMNWSLRSVSLKALWGFPYLISIRFYKEYFFIQQKAWTMWL